MNSMDLNLYKIFYVVASNESLTKATKELYISQPAISKSLRKLEEILNAKLYEKSATGIILTQEGKAVYEYARQICNMGKAGQELVNNIRNNQNDILNIGVPTHIGTFYFLDFLTEFNIKHPNVKVNVINKRSEEMLEMLQRRELDIVIDTDMVELNDPNIKQVEIINLESCFVGNDKFKDIANKGKISVEELIKYPLILPGQSTNNRKVINDYFKKKNVTLSPLIESNSSSISHGIIEKGIGIGWMIKEFVKDEINCGKLYEIKVDINTVMTSVSIAYHNKFISTSTKDFIKIFLKEKNSKD